MTLRDSYQRFLDNPSAGALAENASLHYISTLTSIHNAAGIMKHMSAQEKLLKKTGQKILSTVEGQQGLSVDVETTIEFNTGGGAYLPGLDDNFVADRIVTFPMVHMVHFDQDGRIVQIRQYWDQGSLLKQIDVIGARSRNWPIRDGKDQTKLIVTSSATVDQPGSATSARASTASRGADEVSVTSRGRAPASNITNDPHASLSLFQPREINEDVHNAHPMAPRALSAKPPPREYSELFAGENDTSSSPSTDKIPVKIGGGKNFQSNRLFNDTEEDETMATSGIKTNANKFNHFSFGDSDDEEPQQKQSTNTKGRSSNAGQGLYQDHVTGNADDADDDDYNNNRRQPSQRARQATDSHFEFGEEAPKTTRGNGINIAGNGMGNRAGTQFSLYDEESPVRNVNLGRQQHGDGMGGRKDTSTSEASTTTKGSGINIAGNGMGNRAGTQFSLYDEESPVKNVNLGRQQHGDGMGGRKDTTTSEAPTTSKGSGINIAGNGMGNRAGTQFSLYDEETPVKNVNLGRQQRGDGMGGRKDTTTSEASTTAKGNGINIAGNGMGSRAGTQFSLFDEESPVRNVNLGREQHGDGMGGRRGESYSTNQSAKKENVQSEREQHGDGMGGRKDGNRGINIAGNGMGNRAGTQFSLYDEESPIKKNENLGRAQHGDGMGGRKNEESFWDY
ncbi:hypothetical protein P153DRAFT_309071 [Dothidotthia symphoricarpi CBS 119687]|uniref:NTF2-like protein n=1 Tax=Dothidotthia symphoricarpi CBS 119687 TaxID=1392245 RepID=A0A6A6ANI0_9PLEO|nr:uncharacterized protein P153DRAFT_309071 [Dothidotthia symphoricarpi CBS 119687]KAF2132605.1 hypothetical protein P153DRAFT_309071 [Dothidotthia symphoricarpi CBS 119687]